MAGSPDVDGPPDAPGTQGGGDAQRADNLGMLWAPWRSAYVAGGDDRIDGCPFCVLPARDSSDDATSLILARGHNVFVMLNAYPYNPGHLMVMPYAHVPALSDLDDATASELWETTRRAVDAVERRLDAEGVNLGANLGAAAGAGIAEHLHLHVVPRWRGDTNFMSVTAATRVLSRALAEVYDDLAGAFD